MNFEQMLLTRESCRSYRSTPVAREDLIKICEAGRLSPSGCNAQPWKFLVIDEEASLAKLRDALLLPGGRTGAPWRGECHAFIVLVEQNASKALQVADLAYVLETGKITLEGTGDELAHSDAVRKAYLGG